MELTERSDGLVVLNDSYNANPESMAAALDALAALGRRRTGSTWALLGDMLELGDEAEAEHAALGRRVVEAGIDRLVVIGAFADTVLAGARAAGLAADRGAVVADKRCDDRGGALRRPRRRRRTGQGLAWPSLGHRGRRPADVRARRATRPASVG